jgi:hypothetical protein
MLRFKDRLGLRTVFVKVLDLRGTSNFPLAAYVCEGNSSGSNELGTK